MFYLVTVYFNVLFINKYFILRYLNSYCKRNGIPLSGHIFLYLNEFSICPKITVYGRNMLLQCDLSLYIITLDWYIVVIYNNIRIRLMFKWLKLTLRRQKCDAGCTDRKYRPQQGCFLPSGLYKYFSKYFDKNLL